MLHSFLSDNRKKDAATTATHSKRIIELLKKYVLVSVLYGNTDGCAGHYRCATDLFLLSILSQPYNMIIDSDISAPGPGAEVVDGLNATDERFIFHLMANVQLPGGKRFDTQMSVHTETQNTDVSLAQ